MFTELQQLPSVHGEFGPHWATISSPARRAHRAVEFAPVLGLSIVTPVSGFMHTAALAEFRKAKVTRMGVNESMVPQHLERYERGTRWVYSIYHPKSRLPLDPVLRVQIAVGS